MRWDVGDNAQTSHRTDDAADPADRPAVAAHPHAGGRLATELSVTKALLAAATALSSEIELDPLLEGLATIATEATGISRAFVNLIDVRRGVLYPKVAIGGLEAPGGKVIPLDQLSATSQAAIRAKKTQVLDYDLPEIPEKDRAISSANSARLVLFVPLMFKGEIIGHLSLDEPGARCEFSEAQIRVVEGIAAQASVAVENARLFEQVRESNARLAADLAATAGLHEVSSIFVKEGCLEPVLTRIVDVAMAITGADMGHLQIIDPESGCLRIAAQRGFDRSFIDYWDGAAALRSPSIAGAEQARRIVIEDIAQDSEFLDDAALAIKLEAGVRAVQATPLFDASGSVLGMLSTHYRTARSPDAQALRYLDLLARQAADMISWTNADQALRGAMEETESERTRLRQIMDEIPIGVALVGPDGAVMEVNKATTDIWGGMLPRARSVDQFALYEGYDHDTKEPLAPEQWPAPRAIATSAYAEAVVDFVRTDGTTGIIRVTATPKFGADGSLARIVVITEDVTEDIRERELDDALVRINGTVGATLEKDRILTNLVDLSHAALGSEAARAVVSARDTWRIAHAVDCPAIISAGLTREESEASSLAMSSGRVVRVQDTRSDPRIDARDPRVLSLLAVPLVVQGTAIGALLFDHLKRPADFSPAQVGFAKRVMQIATAALDNARLYEREHRIAKTLQEAILAPPSETSGIEVGFLYRPASTAANVGGDFYDVFSTDSGCIAIAIGDVSGKGLEAARLTTLMRDGVRAYVIEDDDPAGTIRRLNALAFRSTPVEMFATAFLGMLDPATGLLRYCGAGHPSPLIVGPRGIGHATSQSGLIGAFDEAGFVSQQTVIAEDEVLVLYTDGVTEARSGAHMLDESGLEEIVGRLTDVPVAQLPDRIMREVLEFTGGFLHDDIVIVCIKRNGGADA